VSLGSKWVLASSNLKKLAELQTLFSAVSPGLQLLSQGSLNIPEVEEPHSTFIENALLKARHAAQLSGLPALADDSGLCVPALGGEPGVHSARFADLSSNLLLTSNMSREAHRREQDHANNQRLLTRLQGNSQRRAYFVCTLVALRHAQDPEPLVAVGRWWGEILQAPRGADGFGYDPLMFIPSLNLSVAELDAVNKNRFSHRALAMQQLKRIFTEAFPRSV
jgi:XTP/dITP diphosphohydrolase